MPRKWTLEQKLRQRELIQSWQPWTKSTGARSDAGKQRVSLNALKHGNYTAAAMQEQTEFRALLRKVKAELKSLSK